MEDQSKQGTLETTRENSTNENIASLRQMQIDIDSLNEIDVTDIEPLLPPTWKEGRFV